MSKPLFFGLISHKHKAGSRQPQQNPRSFLLLVFVKTALSLRKVDKQTHGQGSMRTCGFQLSLKTNKLINK